MKLKLFLPLAIVCLILDGYLFTLWLPKITNQQIATVRALNQRELKALADTLLPMVAAGQLGDIHDTLASLEQQYPEWSGLTLTDPGGRVLYPLPGTPAKTAPDSRTERHEEPLEMAGQPVGSLKVTVSYAALLDDFQRAEWQLMATLLATTLFGFLSLAFILNWTIRRPVNRLSAAAQALADGHYDYPLPAASDRDEIGQLVRNFDRMRQDIGQNHRQLEAEIAERRAAEQRLQELNVGLEQRIQEALARERDKDHLLIQQSRLASMGEMVHNIAHQWRQPLNALGLVIRNIKDDYDYQALTGEVLNQSVADALRLLQRMSDTIDDFRNFFRPDRDKVRFDVGQAAEQAIFVVGASLKHYNIEVISDLPAGIEADGFPSQFSQAVLNLLVNAKEAIRAQGGADSRGGHIRISLSREGTRIKLSVEDDGGGLNEGVMPHLFEPYFTTKETGSGIGLYMTKMIIEKNMQGTVSAGNGAQGACFVITLPAIDAEKTQ